MAAGSRASICRLWAFWPLADRFWTPDNSVRLIDGDHDNTPVYALADEIAAARPDALLLGHSGSTPAQPILDELTRLVRPRCPETSIVLGGVFPTFHWADILRSQPQYDYIVRGEGEAVTLALITALARGEALAAVRGIAFRQDGRPVCTEAGPPSIWTSGAWAGS